MKPTRSELLSALIISAALLTLTISTTLRALADAPAAQPPGVITVQKRYQDLLLRLKGVELVTTAACARDSGRLKRSNDAPGPQFGCIAVKVKSPADQAAIETVYENPLKVEGALIHFTAEDPVPYKGGITVHN